MSPIYLFCLGKHLRGKASTYTITKQISEFVYFAVYVGTYPLAPLSSSMFSNSPLSNQQDKTVVVKSVEGHWRLHNERDILNRFQARAPTLRPLLDEIEDPAEPPVIVLKYLDDDLKEASNAKSLTRQEIKYVAINVLEALQVLHQDGYVHTDIKPRNILVDYGGRASRFSDVKLAGCGGVVSSDSEFAKDGVLTGTNLFRAPEVHLGISWGTAADIWSFGVTPVTKLINLIWGLSFNIFEPKEPMDDQMYETYIVVHQHEWFEPFPVSYKEIADEETQEAIVRIMSAVPPEKMKPFARVGERGISNPDKAFVLKIMKLDPRDRPTATELLQDEWFTERSERTVGWYSKEKWQKMQQRRQ